MSIIHDREACIANCPSLLQSALAVMGAKWAAPIVLVIFHRGGTARYGTIARLLPEMAPKELAKNLRRLEEAGLIDRTVIASKPLGVVYALTPAGAALYPALEQLATWSVVHRTTAG